MIHNSGKHRKFAKGENEKNDNFCMDSNYPYICKVIKTGIEFLPIFINYEHKELWRQIGQAEGNGEWYNFDEVIFKANKNFNTIVTV